MSATQKQKEKQLGLVDEIGLEEILLILGQDLGYQTLATALYEAVVTQAQELTVSRLVFAQAPAKAAHMQEAINDLQNLASKLEAVSAYSIADSPGVTNQEVILAANVDFSLNDILEALALGFGVNRVLTSAIKVSSGLADHYRGLAVELGKATPHKLPGQDSYIHEIYERKAQRLQLLSDGLRTILTVYQTNKGTPLQELINSLNKEEKELLAVGQ